MLDDAPDPLDSLVDAVVELSNSDVQREFRNAQCGGVSRPKNFIRIIARAALKATGPTQQSELIERLSEENRKLRDELATANGARKYLAADVARLEKSCKTLEGAVLEAQGRAQDYFTAGVRAEKRLQALRAACGWLGGREPETSWLRKQRSVYGKRLAAALERVNRAIEADRREEHSDG